MPEHGWSLVAGAGGTATTPHPKGNTCVSIPAKRAKPRSTHSLRKQLVTHSSCLPTPPLLTLAAKARDSLWT